MVTETLLTREEVARRLAISNRTLERYICERDFPVVRLSLRTLRFSWPAVEEWIAEQDERN